MTTTLPLCPPGSKRLQLGVKASDLLPGQRTHIKSKTGRMITLIRDPRHPRKYAFVCIDALCYHMGGALGKDGDIENIGNHLSIRCPNHKYAISLDDGSLLQAGRAAPVRTSAPGVGGGCPKQRTHPVHVKDDGSVWVDIALSGGLKLPSDIYNIPSSLGQTPSHSQAGATKKRPTYGLVHNAFRSRKLRATEAIKRKLWNAGHAPKPPAPSPSAAQRVRARAGGKIGKIDSRKGSQTIPGMFAAMSDRRPDQIPARAAEIPQKVNVSPADYFAKFRHPATIDIARDDSANETQQQEPTAMDESM